MVRPFPLPLQPFFVRAPSKNAPTKSGIWVSRLLTSPRNLGALNSTAFLLITSRLHAESHHFWPKKAVSGREWPGITQIRNGRFNSSRPSAFPFSSQRWAPLSLVRQPSRTHNREKAGTHYSLWRAPEKRGKAGNSSVFLTARREWFWPSRAPFFDSSLPWNVVISVLSFARNLWITRFFALHSLRFLIWLEKKPINEPI